MPLPLKSYSINEAIFKKLILEYTNRQKYIQNLISSNLKNNSSSNHSNNHSNNLYLFNPWLISIDDTIGVYANNQIDGETVTYKEQGNQLRIYQADFLRWVDYKLRFGYLSDKEFKQYFEESGLITQIVNAKDQGQIINWDKSYDSFEFLESL